MSSALPPVDERSESIRLIRESVGAVVPSDRSLTRIRRLRFIEPGFDRAVWRDMCAMGWLGLQLPETDGGAGLGMQEACALAEELGRGLVPEPLISAAMTVRLLPRERMADVLSGERIILPAWQESIGAMGPGESAAIVDGRLSGTKLFVAQAGGADAFVVATRDGLALVEVGAPGFTLKTEGCQDGGFFGTLSFESAECIVLPTADLDAALDEAALVTAAYLLGVMDRAFAITLDYLRIRQQFGRPIGSFQALQHRAADMKIQIELTRASAAAAAVALDGGADADRRRAKVSQAKARASEAVMLVTREGVQMHGAIGYTDESDIGLYLRKAMTLANLYGSAAAHRRRYAAVA